MYFLQPKMPQKMLFVWVWASQSMSQMFQTIRTTMLKNREAILSIYDYRSHADVQTKVHLRDNGWESQIGNLAKTWDSIQFLWKPPLQKMSIWVYNILYDTIYVKCMGKSEWQPCTDLSPLKTITPENDISKPQSHPHQLKCPATTTTKT